MSEGSNMLVNIWANFRACQAATFERFIPFGVESMLRKKQLDATTEYTGKLPNL